MICNPYRK